MTEFIQEYQAEVAAIVGALINIVLKWAPWVADAFERLSPRNKALAAAALVAGAAVALWLGGFGIVDAAVGSFVGVAAAHSATRKM